MKDSPASFVQYCHKCGIDDLSVWLNHSTLLMLSVAFIVYVIVSIIMLWCFILVMLRIHSLLNSVSIVIRDASNFLMRFMYVWYQQTICSQTWKTLARFVSVTHIECVCHVFFFSCLVLCECVCWSKFAAQQVDVKWRTFVFHLYHFNLYVICRPVP